MTLASLPDALWEIDIRDCTRAKVTVECVHLLAQRLPESWVLGQVTGPLTIAAGLIGYERFLRLTLMDPAFVDAVLQACTRVAAQFAGLQMEAGATMLWVGEPMGAVISPRLFSRLCVEALATVLAESPAQNILHVCGDTTPHIDLLVATGARVLSLDTAVDLAAIAARVPPDVVVMGNIDPVRILQQGTPETVGLATRELLDNKEDKDNFILSTGCSMPRATPLDNIRALVRAGRGVRAGSGRQRIGGGYRLQRPGHAIGPVGLRRRAGRIQGAAPSCKVEQR